jgi:hypothetical protein
MVELGFGICLVVIIAFFFSPYELTVGEEED